MCCARKSWRNVASSKQPSSVVYGTEPVQTPLRTSIMEGSIVATAARMVSKAMYEWNLTMISEACISVQLVRLPVIIINYNYTNNPIIIL